MEKKNHFDALTGLKGIFSLIIVFFHTLPSTPFIDRIPFTSLIRIYGGMFGNYFFFISSGFLISVGYRQRISNKAIAFQPFLVRRLCKLYPLYLITNFVSLIVNIFQFGPSAINLKNIIFTVLLQNGGGLEASHPYNGPSWFISALFICYILFFFIAYHSKNTTQYFCMIAACIIWGYSLMVGRFTAPLSFAHHGDSIFAFFIGCTLAEVYPKIREDLHKFLQPTSAVLLLTSGFLMMQYGVEVISGDSRVAFACVILPLLIYLALRNNPFSMLLQSKPIQYLGKLSFSIYLWHFVIYDLFRYSYYALSNNSNIEEPQYLLYFVLMLLTSVLSNVFIEKRFG